MNKLLLLAAFFFSQFAIAQNSLPIDTIETYFKNLKEICNKDNGKLWGISTCAPIIVINRVTREIIANEPDNENLLKKVDNIYIGTFPTSKIISCSTTDFGGKFWTMVGYPISPSISESELVIAHEMFHHLQPELKLKALYENDHMSKMQARILTKLEFNALEKAFKTNDNSRIETIKDALIFRQLRRKLFLQADSNENRFEIMEGLAEYTSLKLCINNKNEIIDRIMKMKEHSWNSDSYVRSFGYFTGMCYAFLDDFYGIELKNVVNNNTDLAQILKEKYNIILPNNLEQAFDKIKTIYGFDTISEFENERELKTQKIVAEYRERFTTKSHLIIPKIKASFGFNPNTVIPIDSLGNVYPFIEITDAWGILKVKDKGCLFASNSKNAIISSENIKIDENIITGNDWILTLNENWNVIQEGTNFLLQKTK